MTSQNAISKAPPNGSRPDSPVDTVVRQDPAAGKSASRIDRHALRQQRPAPKQIPFDITTGRTADDVTTELKNLGFLVDPKLQPNAAASGTVYDSQPKPGTSAPVGSTVTIFVSTGPAPVAVPQVKGLSVDQATQPARARRLHEPEHAHPGVE